MSTWDALPVELQKHVMEKRRDLIVHHIRLERRGYKVLFERKDKLLTEQRQRTKEAARKANARLCKMTKLRAKCDEQERRHIQLERDLESVMLVN